MLKNKKFIKLKTTETLQSNRYVTSCFEWWFKGRGLDMALYYLYIFFRASYLVFINICIIIHSSVRSFIRSCIRLLISSYKIHLVFHIFFIQLCVYCLFCFIVVGVQISYSKMIYLFVLTILRFLLQTDYNATTTFIQKL